MVGAFGEDFVSGREGLREAGRCSVLIALEAEMVSSGRRVRAADILTDLLQVIPRCIFLSYSGLGWVRV